MCRVLDYSKYKYEQAQKQKAARKHQQQITVREIKFRPKIAQNDYDTKKGHVRRFLTGKDKVKITIMFRGREVTHPERGIALLDRLAEELSDIGVVEQSPAPGRAQHDDDAGAVQGGPCRWAGEERRRRRGGERRGPPRSRAPMAAAEASASGAAEASTDADAEAAADNGGQDAVSSRAGVAGVGRRCRLSLAQNTLRR